MSNQRHGFQTKALAPSQLAMTLMKKAVVSVKKENVMFSPDQATKVVYLLICMLAKAETKEYVLLLF